VKLTNRLALPSILVKAIQNDSYSGNRSSDYSTTGLLKPPRIAQLLREHGDKIVDDAADRLWALYGQIVHGIIERAATDEIVEKRLHMTLLGKTVSGQVDLVNNKILTDWKFVTRFATKEGVKDDWMQQGQINRLLCHENGIEIEKIEYVALYRDYSVLAASRDSEYPKAPVESFNVPIWPLEKTKAFVEERIRLHEAAKTELPLCTDEERWAKPEKWAHVKRGQKRAVKLYDSEQQAEAAAKNAGAGNSIEHRSGQNTRCEFFCQVSAHCSQFLEIMQEKAA
jgi:hypothetical protein